MTELELIGALEARARRLRRERLVLLAAVLVGNSGCMIASVVRGLHVLAWSGAMVASVAALVVASRSGRYLRALEREICARITAVLPRL